MAMQASGGANLVTATVLVLAGLALAGCLGADSGSELAPAEASTEPQPWSAVAETEVGCQVGAGHLTGPVYSYACLSDGVDYGPCFRVSIPDHASWLSIVIEPQLVHEDRPGAGEYGVLLSGPPDDETKQRWDAPLDTVRYETDDPRAGLWSVFVVAQGAAVEQVWDVTVEAEGEHGPEETFEGLSVRDC